MDIKHLILKFGLLVVALSYCISLVEPLWYEDAQNVQISFVGKADSLEILNVSSETKTVSQPTVKTSDISGASHQHAELVENSKSSSETTLLLENFSKRAIRLDIVAHDVPLQLVGKIGGESFSKVIGRKGKHVVIFPEKGISNVALDGAAIALLFILLTYFIALVLKTDPKNEIKRQISYMSLLFYCCIVWKLSFPGSFTGDADAFIRESRGEISDLVAPLFIILFRPLEYVARNNYYLLTLLSIYGLVFSLHYFVHSVNTFFARSWPLGKPSDIAATAITLTVGLSPVFVGFATLLYLDPFFCCVCLLGLGAYLRYCASPSISRLILTFALLTLTALLRHNSIVLALPIALMLYTAPYVHRSSFFSSTPSSRPWAARIGLPLAAVSLIIGLSTLINVVVVEKKSNYYIATPVYEIVGVASTFREIRPQDIEWIEKYLNLTELTKRYREQNALIPILWWGNSNGLASMQAIYRDHDIIWEKYTSLLRRYPLQFGYIKFRHFLQASGVYDFHLSPFFYDRFSRALANREDLEEVITSGKYAINPLLTLRSHLANTAKQFQKGWEKFVFSSSIFPLLMMFTFFVTCVAIPFRYTSKLWPLAFVCLYALTYNLSYLVFSHGAFLKYGYPTYLIGVVLALCTLQLAIQRLLRVVVSNSPSAHTAKNPAQDA